jgi:hypothetical protein
MAVPRARAFSKREWPKSLISIGTASREYHVHLFPLTRPAWIFLRSPNSAGRHIYAAQFSCGPGPWCASRTDSGNRDRQPEFHRRFRCSSLSQGSRPWNSPIEYSLALTAAPSLSLLRASRSSSTTSSLRTTPSVASSARRSGFVGARKCVLKPAPHVRSAVPRPPSLSSQLRADRYCAGVASRSREKLLLRRRKPSVELRGLGDYPA